MMFESNTESMHTQNLYISASKFIKKFEYPIEKYCLFLDIDGTISEFHPNPNLSFISTDTLEQLNNIQRQKIPIAVVTGRTIQDAIRLFKPLELPIAGTHGLEIRFSEKHILQSPMNSLMFQQIYSDIEAACVLYPKLRIEKKTYAVALHFRECPELEPIAQRIIDCILHNYEGLKLNIGKCVYELILVQADKGKAIEQIYVQNKLNHFTPIFIGDDLTDESGFKTINQMGGISVKVGEGETSAQYRFKDVSATCEFIDQFSRLIQKHAKRTSQVSKKIGEKACLN